MSRRGKKYLAVAEKVDLERKYDLKEALNLLKNNSFTTFDETAEIAFRLGINPTKSDQSVRGSVSLPHGTGKNIRVAVFAAGDAAAAAKEAGADDVGMDDLVEKVQGGWSDFDVAIATPDAMKEVRKLGKFLGPRGLMPNPRTGTVTEDTAGAVTQFKAGRVEYKMDKHGNVIVPFGKLSFEIDKLVENCMSVIQSVHSAKPNAVKGVYIKKYTVTSTMGVGLQVDPKDTSAVA